ncbi:MAG: alpha,2-mannosyltransferase, partial [Pseudonocardiales bacterium]|nr:alpha,2-mannosyltransferase [Pseudonocardiales bacterium]
AVGWLLAAPGRRARAAHVAAGALAAGVLIDVPFLIASRGEMWTMVVSAQLGRDTAGRPVGLRLADLTTGAWPPPDTAPAVVIGAAAATALLIALLVLAWRVRPARLVVIMAVAAVGTLLLAPAWFQQYPDFAAGPIAVCAAAAATALPARLRLAQWVPVLGAGTVTLAVLVAGDFPATRAWGPDRLAAAAQQARCVTSDTPAGLIALDVLDEDLGHGCPEPVDVLGRSLLTEVDGKRVSYTDNPQWQRDVAVYLRSGDLAYPYVLGRPLSPRTLAALRRGGIVARYRDASGRRFTLYRVDH